MTTKTKKSDPKPTEEVDIINAKLTELKEFSLAFINEIDHIMKSQAKGDINHATGAKLLGSVVSQYEKTLTDKF